MKGFVIGETPKGKRQLKITSYDVEGLWKKDGMFIEFDKETFRNLPLSARSEDIYQECVTIPCGSCFGCRLDYAKSWVDRCMIELQQHEQSWFVTFTYDDLHLPVSQWVDDDGVIHDVATLVKSDLSDTIKRIRSRLAYKYGDAAPHIKFYAAGEYGSKTLRPHYHCIIFGLPLNDLELYTVRDGYCLYNSKFMDDVWQHKGHVVVGEVTPESVSYTARYVMKKLYGNLSEVYKMYNVLPEFTLMSRRPAIAKEYFQKNIDRIYKYDKLNIRTPKGGLRIKPPRYYDKLYDIEYPNDMLMIKEVRKQHALQRELMKLEQTSLSYLELLRVEEENRRASAQLSERREL